MVKTSSCRSACAAMQTAVRYWMGETDRKTEKEVERQREKNKVGEFFFCKVYLWLRPHHAVLPVPPCRQR